MTLLLEDEKKTWYFGFCETQAKLPWYQRFCVRNDPKILTHCYAFSQSGPFLLFVEPFKDRVDFTIKYPQDGSPLSADTAAEEISAAGHIVAKHRFKQNNATRKSIWNWVPSCVTVTKVSTGFPSDARTPSHLLAHLLKDGAKII